jgi:hypothetical protein
MFSVTCASILCVECSCSLHTCNLAKCSIVAKHFKATVGCAPSMLVG